MTTIALPQKRIKAAYAPSQAQVLPYSSHAIISVVCVTFFLLFIALFQTPFFDSLSSTSKALSGLVFVVIAPALALLFSVVSLRRHVKFHTEVRGMFLAYISFLVSAVYFVTALAMPLVLLGLYVMYVYIW